MQYLEETKMSKYRFAQESGISISTLYDIIKKEDYDIRESNIIKVSSWMGIGPFELFQKNEKVLVLQKMQEIDLIKETRILPLEYQLVVVEYLHSLRKIAEKSK